MKLKFADTPEDQAQATKIMEAMIDGHSDRLNGVPAYYDKDGTPVYRVLFSGLRWSKYEISAYTADDGPRRVFNISRDGDTRKWGAVLFEADEHGELLSDTPTIIAEGLRAKVDAKLACEQKARRMKWYEGASW